MDKDTKAAFDTLYSKIDDLTKTVNHISRAAAVSAEQIKTILERGCPTGIENYNKNKDGIDEVNASHQRTKGIMSVGVIVLTAIAGLVWKLQ